MSTTSSSALPLSDGGAPQHDLSGRTLAGYHILRKLGQGGMGQVYLAEQISLKRKVALKVLRPELAASPTALARFTAEAHAVAQATHANIVQVYDYGQADGVLFIALEFIEGRNLKEYLARKGPPDLLVALSIMRQVASALQRASELGIIHRDIKPENILLTRKGEVKVADFGLARCLEGDQPPLNLTQSGVTMGTPLYMSPEQVEGKPVDARTDIYSFGVTCYHMLAGHPPFQGSSAFEVALSHVQKQPVPLTRIRPDLPERLGAIVHKMLAKDPGERYQTGRDLLRDIGRLRETLSGVTVAALPATSSEPATAATATTTPAAPEPVPAARSPGKRLRAAFVLTVVAGLGAGVFLGWRERNREGPVPSSVQPADAGALEAICLPNRREQTLRDAVEQYLSVPKGKAPEAGGWGVCADLGLVYLNDHRLDEADKLFTRLEGVKEPRSYHLLGQLGRGIVLAFRNHPRESNELLKQLFCVKNLRGLGPLGPPPKGAKGKKGPEGGLAPAIQKAIESTLQPIQPVLQHDDWRYLLTRARWYNQSNGLGDDEVPRFLIVRYPFRPGGPEPARPGKPAGPSAK